MEIALVVPSLGLGGLYMTRKWDLSWTAIIGGLLIFFGFALLMMPDTWLMASGAVTSCFGIGSVIYFIFNYRSATSELAMPELTDQEISSFWVDEGFPTPDGARFEEIIDLDPILRNPGRQILARVSWMKDNEKKQARVAAKAVRPPFLKRLGDLMYIKIGPSHKFNLFGSAVLWGGGIGFSVLLVASKLFLIYLDIKSNGSPTMSQIGK